MGELCPQVQPSTPRDVSQLLVERGGWGGGGASGQEVGLGEEKAEAKEEAVWLMELLRERERERGGESERDR